MFKLNQALVEWRQQIAAGGIKSPKRKTPEAS